MRKKACQIIALTLLLALTLCACGGARQAESSAAENSAAESTGVSLPVSSAEEAPEEPEYISYPGFIDKTFTSEHHKLTMETPEDNSVSFAYTISYKGDVLFQSDPVAPGESVRWDVMAQWQESGHHTITITSTPILEDGTEGNTSSQIIRVTLNFD